MGIERQDYTKEDIPTTTPIKVEQSDVNGNLEKNEEIKKLSETTSSSENDLMNEIIAEDSSGLNKALKQIDNMPDVPVEKTKTIKDYLAEGNIKLAIKETLAFVGDIFGSFLNIKTGGSFMKEYSGILNNLESVNFDAMDKNEIARQIKKLEIKRDNKSDINKKLSITYIISIFKEQLIRKDTPDINKIGLLEKNITPGTVLLLNKKPKNKENIKSELGRLALENYDESLDVSFSHSVIVSSVNPIKIIHSTMNKFGEKGSGVQEILLQPYLNTYSSVDILALDMPQENKDKALKYSNQKLIEKAGYDDKAALNELSGGKIGSDNLQNVNCAELIAEGLGDSKIKDISNPNDFLRSDILTPTYMTTI